MRRTRRVHAVKTIPTAIVGALGLFVLVGISACGKSEPAQPPVDVRAAQAAASDAQASAADAQAAAAQARAGAPAAGTVANNAGENQKTAAPAVSLQEEAQARGDEAPQDLRAKVAAAQAAGKAPAKP
jgi:hypothetical protein